MGYRWELGAIDLGRPAEMERENPPEKLWVKLFFLNDHSRAPSLSKANLKHQGRWRDNKRKSSCSHQRQGGGDPGSSLGVLGEGRDSQESVGRPG